MDGFLSFSVCILILSIAFAISCFGMSLMLKANAPNVEPKKDEA